MNGERLRVAVLTGRDSAATCLAIEQLLAVPEIEICGILIDKGQVPLRRRLRNLGRSVRREGAGYLWHRLAESLFELVEGWAAGIIPQDEVRQLMREAFPNRILRLADFQGRGVRVEETENLNAAGSAQRLAELKADLGIVIGTRILKRSTFSVPRLGSVNLHKGRVPEYRGQPAGFWEIYDGRQEAGVTVHFVDDGLDTGDIVGEERVAIHLKDTPETLRSKLDMAGAELLAKCVQQIATGSAVRRPQAKSEHKARTSPTRKQRQEVEKRLGMDGPEQRRWVHIAKTALYLGIYKSGLYGCVRAWHGRRPGGRSCILLYHRVNDQTRDVLTTSSERFAEHLVAIRRKYPVVATTQLVKQLKERQHAEPSAVAIHFDDCYRDVYTNASRLLEKAQTPACGFVSSGFIDTDRVFPHDEGRCPFQLENLRAQEISGLVARGFEIGSHTVNHADLGRVPLEQARVEITESRKQLETILGQPVNFVSFPYGKKANIRPEVTEMAKQTGYEAMFSAYGGYVNREADLFDLKRIGVSGQHRPLDLLLTIEGLTLETLKQRWK